VALRFTERFRDQYKYVFYVSANTSAAIVADYRRIARRLRLYKPDQKEIEDTEVVELLKAWLSENTAWLMVFDNALEPGTVRRYTPVEGNGHVLFTTRSSIAAEALSGKANTLELLPLSHEEAIQLTFKLQNIVEADLLEIHAAQRLAHMVAGLPIAVEQTVSLACLRKISLSAILPELERKSALLKQSHPNSMHEDGYSTSAILTMTLDALRAESPQAAELFRLLVYFEPSSIPKEVITQASQELKSHFARRETYDRGFIQTPADLRERRLQAALANAPFYYQDPFTGQFWRDRIPFRKRLPPNTLPRIDSAADRNVEHFLRKNSVLQDVLEKPSRIENAFIDLRQAGLIRYPDDKTIWIHDLFAQLTVALLEEESQTSHQATAYTVLLMIYFVFPIPDYSREYKFCLRYLPHAVCILSHCKAFYSGLTMGPELAHMTAATFNMKLALRDEERDPATEENAIYYYKLAFTGYHYAWRRLREHPLVTEKEIILCARAEYRSEEERGKLNIYFLHYHENQRFGSFAAVRSIQTCLKLGGHLYQKLGRYDEALEWTERAVKGVQGMYGERHDETAAARTSLQHLYRETNEWAKGYVLGWVIAKAYMERWGGGLICINGGHMASAIGDCALHLGRPAEAAGWYGITYRGLVDRYGPDDREQQIILLKLAMAENAQHRHLTALEYARQDLAIYENVARTEEDHNQISESRLVDIETAMALQEYALANLVTAQEGCERALRLVDWDSRFIKLKTDNYKSEWESGLEAVWLWGCIHFDGDRDVREWDIPHLKVTSELSRQAIKMYGSLRAPCCGRNYGNEGLDVNGGHDAQLQRLLEELG
jgi:NB-ARC domain